MTTYSDRQNNSTFFLFLQGVSKKSSAQNILFGAVCQKTARKGIVFFHEIFATHFLHKSIRNIKIYLHICQFIGFMTLPFPVKSWKTGKLFAGHPVEN